MEAGGSGEPVTGGFGRDARAVGYSVEIFAFVPPVLVAVRPNRIKIPGRAGVLFYTCFAWEGGHGYHMSLAINFSRSC